MAKIQAGDDAHWLLNGVPHQRGQFDVSTKIDGGVVTIYAIQTNKTLATGNFDSFTDATDTPYTSTQALVDDLKTFFFRSVAGGGGVTDFLGLTDTPTDYTGQGEKAVTVKTTEDGLEFTDTPTSTTIKYITGLLVRTQNTIAPSLIDTPELIDFGTTLQQDATTLYNAGVITLVGAGQRKITFEGSYGRLGAAGTARLFAWFTLERGIDPETPIGNSGYAELDDQDSTFPFNNSFDFDAQDGDIIRVYMIRDSGGTGINQGFLESGTPINTTAPASVSASIQVQYLQGNAIPVPVPSDVTLLEGFSTDIAGDLIGNTNFVKTFTVTGAIVGDRVNVGLSDTLYNSLNSSGQDSIIRGRVTSANTVEVTLRCDSFITVVPGWYLWAQIIKPT